MNLSKCSTFIIFIMFYTSLLHVSSLTYSQNSDALYQLDGTHESRTKRDTDMSNDETEMKNDTQKDNHDYYQSKYRQHKEDLFIDLTKPQKGISSIEHTKASVSHRKAYNITLGFPFRFYGHTVNNIIVTTGGFIHIGPRYHAYIHLVHYIAPLMADFDPSANNDSSIHIGRGDDMFIVQWSNMTVTNETNTNLTFTFQAILYKSGAIRFAYKTIPVPLTLISNVTHKVTVGFSDGYVISFKRHRGDGQIILHNYIHTYHKVKFPLKNIRSGVVYDLVPLTTCNLFLDCYTCANASNYIPFACGWCPIVKRCSDRFDWHRQEWIAAHCDTRTVNNITNCSSKTFSKQKPAKTGVSTGLIIGGVVGVFLFVFLVFGAYYFYYAYTHPQTKSGMWLIEHHPRRFMKRRFDPVAEDDLL